MRDLIILGSILSAALMFGGELARAEAAAKKPNIVFIVTDNLGEKRPVMSAEREGVHCASTLKLSRRMPSVAR
jgi:hypothetical protein